MKAGEGLLTVNRGIARSADDRYRGAIIERLLCDGRAAIGGRLMTEVAPRLRAFRERGLVTVEREWVTIEADGLPYARTIAALFDSYRNHSPRRFSSAV
jgi:oxygen-independent coproporphyrinogen-3 oxidase